MQRYLLCIILGVLLLLTGCSNGGDVSAIPPDSSGNSDSSIASDGTGDNGSVAVLLTDGPADGYDHIWVWITEISLLTDDDSDPVVVFESDDPEGWKVDLLDLRDQEAVVTVNDDIPAGHYDTIRLHIADILPEGDNASCDNMELELPDGKIDLEPKGGIEVIPGETKAIHIDIDCDQSIDLQHADRSGTCIFRPMVFVEIDTPDVIKKCPRVLKGKIETIQEGYTGFTLRLGYGRGLLTVFLNDDVVIFGKHGMPVPPEDLEPDQWVHVRGQLDKEGNLQASAIVIGYVLQVKGMVETPYDTEEAMFSLNLMLSKLFPNFPDFIIDIGVNENTLVMTGCDQMVDPSAIQAGMRVRVVAKLSLEDWSIKAIAVRLKDVNDTDIPTDDTDIPTEVIGTLTDVAGPDDEGGYVLLVEGSDPGTSEIYMPAGVEPDLYDIDLGDIGPVSIDELQRLTDCGQNLDVNIIATINDSSQMIASAVHVNAVRLEGMVDEIPFVEDDGTVMVTLEIGVEITVIAIPPTAIITDDSPGPMGPDTEIEENDSLSVSGLNTCDGGDYDFKAYMVTIM